MASRVYSERLFVGHLITSGSLTVLPGDTAVIRYISAFYPGLAVVGGIQLVDDATDTTIYAAQGDIISGGAGVTATDLRIVLPPGSTTHILTTSNADVCLSGYLLSLP